MNDIHKASRALSELDLKFKLGSAMVEVQWFRISDFRSDHWVIERHTHSFFEFHFIRSGGSRVILDSGEFIIHSGKFYLTAPGVYHEQVATGTKGMLEYCLCCDTSLGTDADDEARRIVEVLTKTPCQSYENAGMLDLFETALEEAHDKPIGFHSKIANIASILITSAARVMAEQKTADYEVPLKSLHGDHRFNQIDKFIDDNITGAVTIRQISDFIYLSEKQVSRIIEKNTGISGKEYIIYKKTKKATELLEGTTLSVKEISDMLGFSSEYYFSQFYKRVSGHAPSVLRNILNINRKL